MSQDRRSLEARLMEIKYASRYVLLAELLEKCKEPITKSELFYELKTSYSQYRRLLRFALQKGLLKKQDSTYHITSKGLQYIKKLNELLSILEG